METNVRFVERIETATNPKDVYYQNTDDMLRAYMFITLVGVLLVFYMWIF